MANFDTKYRIYTLILLYTIFIVPIFLRLHFKERGKEFEVGRRVVEGEVSDVCVCGREENS